MADNRKIQTTTRLALVVLFVLMGSVTLMAQDRKTVTIAFQNENATTALRRVEKLSGIRIQYNYGDVDFNVTLSAQDEKPLSVVRAIIEGHPLRAVEHDGYIVITREERDGQKVTDKQHLEGVVVDASGLPIIGAVVRDRQSKTQAITDMDGKFSIPATHERIVLDISYLGMKPATWEGKPGDYVLSVLEDDTQQLQDVIVVRIVAVAEAAPLAWTHSGHLGGQWDGERLAPARGIDDSAVVVERRAFLVDRDDADLAGRLHFHGVGGVRPVVALRHSRAARGRCVAPEEVRVDEVHHAARARLGERAVVRERKLRVRLHGDGDGDPHLLVPSA